MFFAEIQPGPVGQPLHHRLCMRFPQEYTRSALEVDANPLLASGSACRTGLAQTLTPYSFVHPRRLEWPMAGEEAKTMDRKVALFGAIVAVASGAAPAVGQTPAPKPR